MATKYSLDGAELTRAELNKLGYRTKLYTHHNKGELANKDGKLLIVGEPKTPGNFASCERRLLSPVI